MNSLNIPKAKAPELGGDTGPLGIQLQHNATTRARQPRKWQRVLEAFVTGRSYNRFEAERAIHDHCLHSTVSTLQAMGVTINRRMETVPGFQGCPTEVMRYWLAPESRQKALELLGRALPCPNHPGAAMGPFNANTGA